jgi:hypothetical protein
MAASGEEVLGGIQRPLYVGNLAPAQDEYGRNMLGSRVDEPIVSRVEIRVATDGIIRPPETNGAAHALNPLLAPDSVGGMGMNSVDPNSGLFCMVFPTPPPAGTKLFARIYNAPTAAAASFYVDSTVVAVPPGESALAVMFGALRPLDEGDGDGDGLNNSWERSLGIYERPGPDYDGDGMGDLQEMLAGTDPSDADSLLEFISIQSNPPATLTGPTGTAGQTLRVQWQSKPGRKYQLEHLSALQGEPASIPVGNIVTAGENEFEIDMQVELPDEMPLGVFRVRLITEVGP